MTPTSERNGAKLSRIQRLTLDAVEQLGPDVPSLRIREYVAERQWWPTRIYVALVELESRGLVRSRWYEEEDPAQLAARGGLRRRLYTSVMAALVDRDYVGDRS